MLHVAPGAERAERPSSVYQETSDPSRDQEAHEVVVECPSRLVARCHRVLDDADAVVNQCRRDGQRLAAVIAGDHNSHVRPCDERGDDSQPSLEVPVGQRAPLAPQHAGDLARGAPCVAHDVTLDTRGRRSLQVGSECLATAPAYVVRMVCRKQQDASEEPLPREKAERGSPKYSPSACPADVSDRATYSLGVRTRRTLNATTRRGRRIEAATSRATDRTPISSPISGSELASTNHGPPYQELDDRAPAAMLPPRGCERGDDLGLHVALRLVGNNLTHQRGVGAAAFALLELLHKVQRLRSLAGGRVCGAGLSADPPLIAFHRALWQRIGGAVFSAPFVELARLHA